MSPSPESSPPESSPPEPSSPERAAKDIPSWLTLLLASACGLIVANNYYAQPLVGPISAAVGLSAHASGFIVTVTQLGYGVGLLLVVPLSDLLENRRLIAAITGLATFALVAAGLADSASTFLVAAFCIGLGSVAVQILIPYAAHFAPQASRGRVVGNVMSGLMLGIMLARPISSFIAHAFGWHAVFFLSALMTGGMATILLLILPPRRPIVRLAYGGILASMAQLFLGTALLRRRAWYQACLFGAFSLFWTTTPLLLASPAFGLSQQGIAWFALAGVAGTIAAPVGGRLADRGWSQPVTGLAIALAALAFPLTLLFPPAREGVAGSPLALAALVASAIILDCGVSASLIMGQRAIFALGEEIRGRLNALFVASLFIGGAAGSALGGWAFASGGWPLAAGLGFALPCLAFLAYLTEFRRKDKAPQKS